VEQSVQDLEWQAEAARRAKIEALLRVLRKRFPPAVPADIENVIQTTTDPEHLNRWLEDAAGASTLAAFRRLAGFKGSDGAGPRKSKRPRAGGQQKKIPAGGGPGLRPLRDPRRKPPGGIRRNDECLLFAPLIPDPDS
jgi:hypothetical protein